MATRQIERGQWQAYFDNVSRKLPNTNIDVEVSGPDIGAQTEARHLQLIGLSYDPHDDAFSFISEQMEHRVNHPRQIAVQEEADELRAIEIVDDDEHTHIGKLTEALKLPSPENTEES